MVARQSQIAAWQLSDAHSRVLVAHNLSGNTQAVDVSHAGVHRFDTLQQRSQPGTTLANAKRQLPPHSSAILR